MRTELSRRHLLRGCGCGLTGLLAGCVSRPWQGGSNTDREPTEGESASRTDGEETNTEAETPPNSNRARWRKQTEGPVGRLVFHGDGLYAITYWNVYRLAPEDGSIVWTHQLDDPDDTVCYDGGLVVDDDFAYVLGCDGLRALSTDDGSESWQTDAVTSMKAPTTGEETLYASGYDEGVAVETDGGVESWSTAFDGEPSRSTVAGGLVAVGGQDGVVSTLDAATGEMVWTYDTERERAAVPTITDEAVYVGTSTPSANTGRLFALDPSDGSRQWQVETGQVLSGSRPVLTEDAIYLGTGSGAVHKHARDDGTQQWRFRADDWLVTQPAVDRVRGVVYAGSNDGRLYAIDATDGLETWSVEAGYPHGAPVVDRDTVFYAGDAMGAYDAAGTT